MEENKRKAMNEKDPAQKALLLQLIEEDGKKLKSNIKKQQELSNKFNFDPNKRIDDLIDSIKQAIKNSDRGGPGGGGRSGRNKNNNNNNNDDSEDDDEDSYNGPGGTGGGSNPNSDEPKDKNQNQPTQQQLLISAGLALLIIFFFMNQKSEKTPNYYDF